MVKHDFQPCPGIAQVVINYQYDAQNIQNTLYFENTELWVRGDMQALASAVDAAVVANLMADYAADVSYLGCTATDLTSLATERHRVEQATPVPGGTGGISGPANVCLAVSFLTASRGKGQQGRIFVGPIIASKIVGDKADEVWAGAYLGDLNTVIAAAKASKTGTQHVILSRWENKVWRAVGIGKLVTGVAPQNFYLDSQRDRLPFHKKHKRPAQLPPAP